MSNRIKWIDIAKGIGILLVILGHSQLPYGARKFIFSFHVPLFFFLSGFLSTKKQVKFSDFAIKKVRSLLIPYFIFSIILLLYVFLRVQTGTIDNVNITRYLIGIFYSIGVDQWMVIIPLWFITCLFVVELLFFPIKKIKNNKLIVFIILILSFVGYGQSLFQHIRLPWNIEIAFTALVFFGIGYLCSTRKSIFIVFKNNYTLIFIFLISIILNFLFTNDFIDMNNNYYGNYFNFYIAAFSGIIFTLIISYYLSASKVLNFLGKNTLIILALHGFLLSISEKIMDLLLGPIKNLYIYSFFTVGLTLFLLIPFIYMINKFLPIIIGRSTKEF